MFTGEYGIELEVLTQVLQIRCFIYLNLAVDLVLWEWILAYVPSCITLGVFTPFSQRPARRVLLHLSPLLFTLRRLPLIFSASTFSESFPTAQVVLTTVVCCASLFDLKYDHPLTS